MSNVNIKDRFWLWGMPVNVLQNLSEYAKLNFGTSTMTVEDAIKRSGAKNVLMAGGFPITEETLATMPSAERIICKWSFHESKDDKMVINYDKCLSMLMGAKSLAAQDTRIEGFLVDDFSTGSIEAGVTQEHVARLQYENALHQPQLPLLATVYTMTVDRPELPPLLPYFSSFLVPLWHSDQIDKIPDTLTRLADLSGGKPVMLCLYVYDFGNGQLISRDLMKRHLDLAEKLLAEDRVFGLCVCGTCMMDLNWESNEYLFEWLNR